MEKNRNPDAAEIALPVNAFPVHSGFREKGKKNDLAAVNVEISMSIPAPRSKINTHISLSTNDMIVYMIGYMIGNMIGRTRISREAHSIGHESA